MHIIIKMLPIVGATLHYLNNKVAKVSEVQVQNLHLIPTEPHNRANGLKKVC